MQAQDSYSEQVYEILRQFLPQIQKEIRQELDAKYKSIYQQKYSNDIKLFQEQLIKKQQEQINKITLQRQLQIKQQYKRLYETKVRDLEAENQEVLKRFKNQFQNKKECDTSKDKQLNILLAQKANWEKLEKQYQKTIRQISSDMTNNSLPLRTDRQDNRINKSIEKEKKGSFISPLNGSRELSANKMSNNKMKMNFCGGLKIDIPKINTNINNKENEGIYSEIGSQLYKKDDNISDYSSLLSPPNIEEPERKKNQSKEKRSVFWNEQKKKELLDMIRKRMI